MSELAHRQRIIGRVAAGVLIVFTLVYGYFGLTIHYSFSSDPIGPRGFPAGLAAALLVLGAWYWLSPGQTEEWPAHEGRQAALTFLVASVACVVAMDWIGFVPAMFILLAVIARMFGASWPITLVSGAGQALLWWLLFGPLLGGTLPKGPLGF